MWRKKLFISFDKEQKKLCFSQCQSFDLFLIFPPFIQALQAAVDVVRGGNLSESDVARGKALLKLALAESFETLDQTVNSVANQAVTTGVVKSLPDLLAEVDAVQASQVHSVSTSSSVNCRPHSELWSSGTGHVRSWWMVLSNLCSILRISFTIQYFKLSNQL